MKTLRVMVCGLLMFSILGCPVLAAAAPMAGEMDPAAVEAMDPNVIAPDGAVVEDAAPAVPEGADQENALPPAGDQIVDAEPVAQEAAIPAAGVDQDSLQVVAATPNHTYYNQFGYGSDSLCFLSCIAMIVSDLGNKVTPGDVYKANGKTAYANWSKIDKAFGVTITSLTNLSNTNATNSKKKVVSLLNSGNYPQGIYLWIKGNGHAVVARKVVKGKIYCDDPGQRSGGCCIPLEKCYGYSDKDGCGGIGYVGTVKKSSSWPGTYKSTDTPKYTVTLKANGGKVSKSSITVTNGKTYSSLPTPTRSGYTFDGWYTATTGGDKVTSSTKVNLKKNQTLYAHWKKKGETKKTYTVTFNPNGGTVNQKTKKVEANGVIGSMPTPTRKGYTFHGWSTSQSGAGMLLTTGDEMLVNKNTTLYAQWKKVTTEIKFSGLTAPKTLKQGSIYSLGGTITSKNSNIASIKAEVINNSTKKAAISSSDSGLNTSKYSLPKSKVDNNLKFGKLKAGTYYIKYTVKAKDGTTETGQTATFTVKK